MQEQEDNVKEDFEAEVKNSKRSSKKISSIGDLPGVGAATAEKLRSAGFDSILSIAVATPGEVVEASGVTESAARKMINGARDGLEMGFESGDDLLKKREKVGKITTGSKAFDDLMGGGFETGAITEIFSEFGGGKTQMGHILAVRIHMLKNEKDPVAVYIDTENTFRPERIKQLAKGAGVSPEMVLKSTKVARAYNSDHQMFLVEKIEDLINKGLNVRLVVIDSLTAHFRAEFIGRGTLAERQQKLNKHMHMLLKRADTHNICVYVTNQVQVDPAQFFGDPTKAVGGHIVGHASTFRIYMRKGKKGSRVAKLIDSPNLAEGECNFFITEDGLKDL